MEDAQSLVRETMRALEQKEKERQALLGKPLMSLSGEGLPKCSVCQDTGWIYKVDSEGTKRAGKCQCVIDRELKAEIRRLIPEKFREVDLRSIKPQESMALVLPIDKQREILADLKSDPVRARSFMGPTGVGKTFLMCAIAREAILSRRRVFFTKMNVLVRALRDEEYNRLPEDRWNEAVTIDNLIPDEWGRPTHLYIDEFDKVPGFKDIYPRVFDLVDFCYTTESRARLFITTNLGPDEFVEEWGAALFRRIEEISPFMHLYRE